MGTITGSSPDFTCRITLNCYSDRYFAFRKARNPGHPGYEIYPGSSSTFLYEPLGKIRAVAEPAWRNEHLHSTEHARTPEEIDWMVEDLLELGLPILEKARTIEGVNWLYTSEEAGKLYPDNLSQCREGRTIAFYEAILYARWANDPHFEEIVEFVLDFNRSLDKRGWDQARIEEWVNCCRTITQPVGRGPA